MSYTQAEAKQLADRSAFKPDKRLKNWYDKYNKRYFDGRLPDDVQVGWSDTLHEETYGLTVGAHEEEPNHLYFLIYLDSRLKETANVGKLTLLHEMSHVSIYPYTKHGKRFDEEMLRLALRGAFNGLW